LLVLVTASSKEIKATIVILARFALDFGSQSRGGSPLRILKAGLTTGF
jgi:hypothetical protein